MGDMHTTNVSTIVASQDLNVKSHKAPGGVSMRAVHGSNRSPSKPNHIWIVHCLKPRLKTLGHILVGNDALIHKLQSVYVCLHDALLKFYTKVFP